MGWFTEFAMRAVFPPTDALPGIAETDLTGFVRQLRREAPLLMRLGLWLATWFFIVTPLFTVFIPLPAFLLPSRLLAKHTERLFSSRSYIVRQLVYLLKMLGALCWGQDPEVRRRFGREPLPPDPGTWQGQSS